MQDVWHDLTHFIPCETGQAHLKRHGVHFRRDLNLKSHQKPYINTGIFLDSIRTVCEPNLVQLCSLAVLAQEAAVLLMVHCSAHVTDDVIRILTEARVRVITFVSHTTQVFQVFDLTLFGVLKRCPTYQLPFDENNATVKVITKV
jgi:hypothetical protein